MIHPVQAAPPPITVLFSLIFIIPLIIFWLWMFREMLNNDNLPSLLATGSLTGDQKSDWALAFVFLNVFAAVIYYANVYRNRR